MKVGLIDCNAFFVSAELLFRPDLKGKPCVVLSSNDGCVVSRNSEAKALKIKMGQPFFEIKPLVASGKLTAFSSNFSLYADCSRRVKTIIGDFFPHQEVYSIDESFVSLEPDMGIKDALVVRERILKETGIPVSVGIAPTKVLAKLATDHAKSQGVFEIFEKTADQFLDIPVEELWGISKATGEKLRSVGIINAIELKRADQRQIRRIGGVVLERIARELSGTPCLDIKEIASPKKSICSSQSFGKPLRDLSEIQDALTGHVSSAAEELRTQGSVCRGLEVILSTNRFRGDPYIASSLIRLPSPTHDTPLLISAANAGLEKIYKAGRDYQKTGVTLLQVEQLDKFQFDLFEAKPSDKNTKLLEVIDSLNRKMGKNSVTFGIVQGAEALQARHEMISPPYTTSWNSIPKIKSFV